MTKQEKDAILQLLLAKNEDMLMTAGLLIMSFYEGDVDPDGMDATMALSRSFLANLSFIFEDLDEAREFFNFIVSIGVPSLKTYKEKKSNKQNFFVTLDHSIYTSVSIYIVR